MYAATHPWHDVPADASGLMTADYGDPCDPAPGVDLLRATVDGGVTFLDTADIVGRHADHQPVEKTPTVLATERHGTAPSLQIRPFPRFES